MVTLEDAVAIHQRIHTLVEQYALSIKRNQPASHLMQNLKRQMPTLAGKLKGQFGMISDLVTATNMTMTRGASDVIRVRSMREGVAAIKVRAVWNCSWVPKAGMAALRPTSNRLPLVSAAG